MGFHTGWRRPLSPISRPSLRGSTRAASSPTMGPGVTFLTPEQWLCEAGPGRHRPSAAWRSHQGPARQPRQMGVGGSRAWRMRPSPGHAPGAGHPHKLRALRPSCAKAGSESSAAWAPTIRFPVECPQPLRTEDTAILGDHFLKYTTV